jgi:peroxiredoxin
MQQIVDLEEDDEFGGLEVELVSIAFDPPEVLAAAGEEYGVGDTPLLSDPDGSVSGAYDVLRWAVATGEPGHTFVLVDGDGEVAWIQDYGDPENRGVMYVEPSEIAQEVAGALRG